MLDKLNGITNLDYTIELDGEPYNITAADSLNADVARRTREALHIALSNYKETTADDFDYDGHYPQSISIVPSSGGKFTGNIITPNIINIEDNKDYAINLFSVKKLIANLQGFPTYILEGDTLVEVNVNDTSLSPFKVVLYSEDTNNPTNIKFKDAANQIIKCYFLAINLKTGWLSLGYCDSVTTYTDLRVRKVDYAKTISQYNADDEPINFDTNVIGETNENRPFDHARLLGMENHLEDLGDTTEEGTVIYNITNNITEHTKNIDQLNTNSKNYEAHINNDSKHRLICHGSAEPSSSDFEGTYKTSVQGQIDEEITVPTLTKTLNETTGEYSYEYSYETIKNPDYPSDDSFWSAPIGSIYIKLES